MARGRVDFSEFKEYVKNFQVAKADFERFLRGFLIEQAEALIGRAKSRTPVGTPESTGKSGYIGGTLRASWQVGEVLFSGTEMQVEILNGAEYASHVEYGHATRSGGWVDGRYMLTISMDEIQREMPARFDAAFKQWAAKRGL